ncbi:MAG: NB-ARC domain-containing protein [Lachnospiraceae bacterium]
MAEKITEQKVTEVLQDIRKAGVFYKDYAWELMSLLEGKHIWSAKQCALYTLKLVQTFVHNQQERETLLAAFGLLRGYEYIEGIEARREKYYRHALAEHKLKTAKTTLQKREDGIIERLAAKIVGLVKNEAFYSFSNHAIDADYEWEEDGPDIDIRLEIDLPFPRYRDESPVRFPFNNLPYNRNLYFTGREDKLDELSANFFSTKSSMQLQTISGMGGVGKSQLALQYAYNYYDDYDSGILWLNAETLETLSQSVTDLLEKKGIADSGKQAHQAFLSWLENNRNWLLIYDNVEDYDTIQAFMPRSNTGHILITSRVASAYKGGTLIELPVFPEETAVSFLHNRTRIKDNEGAEKLARRLGYFPLALEHAAAYIIAVPNMNFERYLHRLEEFGVKVLDKPMELTDYARTIRETLEISIERIRDASEGSLAPNSAEQYLYLSAYLAPDATDTWIFRRHPQFLPEPLRAHIFDDLAWDGVMYSLARFSLIKPNEDYGYSIHRLVQEIIRDNLRDDVFWVTCCFETFYRLISERTTVASDAGAFIDLSPHAIAVAEYMDAMSEHPDKRLAEMYHWFSYSMAISDHFMYFDKKHMSRAIEIYEEVLGADNPETAVAYICMADILERKGDTETANIWYKKATASGVTYTGSDRGLFFDWFDRKLPEHIKVT